MNKPITISSAAIFSELRLAENPARLFDTLPQSLSVFLSNANVVIWETTFNAIFLWISFLVGAFVYLSQF